MTTAKDLRALTGLSQAAFADRFHIPKRTIQNWEGGVSECPVYVLELLEYRIKKELE